MVDLNLIDKEETIQIIKKMFSEMCSSRRQLKPILNEILRAIDNNVFIDANSDEVKDLLEEILQMQDKLSQVDELQTATKTKKLSVIDDTIKEIDRKYIINEIKIVLSRFKDLVCDSDDENELEVAKKLKRQAQKLSMKVEKIDPEVFTNEGSKFIDIVEKIEDPLTMTANSFIEIQNNFPENKFLVYSIMKHSLRFETEDKKEIETKIETKPEIELETETEVKPKLKTEIDNTVSETEVIQTQKDSEKIRLDSLQTIFGEIVTEELFIQENEFKVETKNTKKKLSVKSLNNKLHTFVDGSESVSFPILKTFCKCRVFSIDSIFDNGNEDRAKILMPIIFEKLFNWGIVNKVSWQGINFYYLNDSGQEILSKVLSVKDIKLKNILGSEKKIMATHIRRFMLFTIICLLKMKKPNIKPDGYVECFWMRSVFHLQNKLPQTIFVFSLMLFDDDWLKNIDTFLQSLKEDKMSSRNVKGVLFISHLDYGKLMPWIELFKKFEIENIFIFQIQNDILKLIDKNGQEISAEQLSRLVLSDSSKMEQNLTEDVIEEIQEENFIDNETNLVDDENPNEDKIDYISDDNLNYFTEKDIEPNENFDEKIEFDDEIQVEDEVEVEVEVKKSTENESTNEVEETKIVKMPSCLEDFNSEEDFVGYILNKSAKYFIEGNAYRGSLLLHLLTLNPYNNQNNEWAMKLNLEIGYILDNPFYSQQLRTIDTFDFWDNYFPIPNLDDEQLYDYLNLAAIIKSFYSPPEPMSFQLKSRWNQLNDDRSNVALINCPTSKQLINLFKTFAEQTHASFATCINVDNSSIENELKNAIESIKTIRERTDAVAHMQIRHPRSKGLVKFLYEQPDGIVRKLLNIEDKSVTSESIIKFCNQFSEEDLNRSEVQSGIVTEEIFSESKIGDYLDDIWSSVKVESRKNEKFTSVERPRQLNVFKQALEALLSYAFAKKHLESVKTSGKHKAPVVKALEILKDISNELNNVELKISPDYIGIAVFKNFITNITSQIQSKIKAPFYIECLIGSNYLELSKEYLPVTKSYGVETFSFINQVLKFDKFDEEFSEKTPVQIAYETAVRNCDLGIIKMLEANFKQALGRSDEELRRRQDNVAKQVNRQLERIYHEFLDNIELDRNYDRITNQEEIERYIAVATEAKEHFEKTKNAGIYQRFIDACKSDIEKAIQPHKEALLQRLQLLKEKLDSELDEDEEISKKYPIVDEIYKQLDVGNLTVAEDYLNRWNEGQFNNIDVIESQNDSFENFLNDYEYIFNTCLKNKSDSLEKIHSRMRGGIAKNRSERDAADFVSAWQVLNTDAKGKVKAEAALVEVLKHLSFGEATVDKSEKIPPNQWNFHVSFPNYRRAKAAYPHPFAVYGTEIATKGLTVIYIASNQTSDNIIETLANYALNRDCGVICLADFAFSLAERRRLAQAFKLRPDLKNILVIDRVLAIFLTRFEDNVRGVKMMKAALPFACVQPYTTGSVVAPEMFIGRSKELAKIRDMSGPVFVYGGRQLGKSALLRQVRNIENDPDNGNFAFFIELKGLNCDKSLEKIVQELKEANLINDSEIISSWDDFSLVIKNIMNGKAEQSNIIKRTPNKFILLLDESDEFLASIETSQSRAIDVLRELRETFSGSFKFILAGLHKVIRFEKNSSFGNLDHISILPFTPTDALELLLKPMSYLGFEIDDVNLMRAIFSRANYYPGLIQYYCKMIVDAAGDNYIQKNFDVTKNPPYKLDDEYLKNMLGKRDFQDEINKKFQITLKLDDDNYYEIIALVIAVAYYENNRPVHVDINFIKDTCFIYDIDKIADMNDSLLESLLSEMIELNLLRKIDGEYEFNRYAFWHMMGTKAEVISRLESIAGEEK